ncbi:MAG: hypothetical protein AAF399_18525 [Bacteroidota bacterium]
MNCRFPRLILFGLPMGNYFHICTLLLLGFSLYGCSTPASDPESGMARRIKEADSLLQAFVFQEILTKPEERRYFSDIRELEPVEMVACDSLFIHYQDTLDGQAVELKLSLQAFDPETNEITYDEPEGGGTPDVHQIDGKRPWGGEYMLPNLEVSSAQLSINGQRLDLIGELEDLFDLWMCEFEYGEYFQPMPFLVYDRANNVFYLYLRGGEAASTFFGKLIFNEQQFIGRYLLDYVELSQTASLRRSFRGF